MAGFRSYLAAPGGILLPGNRAWRDDAGATLLHTPARVLSTDDPDDVVDVLRDAEAELAQGRYVAGFISFEAGAAFGLCTHAPSELAPLVWLGSYPAEHVQAVPARDLRAEEASFDPEGAQVNLNISRDDYADAIRTIKAYIAAGDTYQVNYTCHARFAMQADPLEYFLTLIRSHPVPYAAYVNTGDVQIASLSPELLLRKRGQMLETKPMKGTRPRGCTPEEDAALAADLVTSEKDRAENLMIVDMMRNDLGRICEIGTVKTPILFSAEKYGTVWQMTSTVVGRVPSDLGLAQIMAVTFPGASVTGAPKVRTMEIIHELEPEARGVYCGAIGLFMPDGDFTCNLPIRTLVHRDGHFDLGIGSGIVWDSGEQSEYDETLLKSQFAFRVTDELRLWETLRLTEHRELAFLEQHLARMAGSAEYWDFPFDAEAARARLEQFAQEAEALPLVLRIELDHDGELHFTPREAPEPVKGPVRVRLSGAQVDPGDRFLYHKTSRRDLYNQEREDATRDGFFEVLFTNIEGRLTEGSITNVFLLIDGDWVTPPISEGLLPGLWRAAFLRKNEGREAPLPLSELGKVWRPRTADP